MRTVTSIPQLPALLEEAQALQALWLKVSLGHFTHTDQFNTLRGCLVLLKTLPNDVPRGIEFPLEEQNLTAVTHRYVELADVEQFIFFFGCFFFQIPGALWR